MASRLLGFCLLFAFLTASPVLAQVRALTGRVTNQETGAPVSEAVVSVDRSGISARTGAGIDALTRRLAEAARERIGVSESPAITRARYRDQLQACMSALQAFMSGGQSDMELRAEDLRQATHALGRITGRVDVEDVLGQIFGRFCIGK